MFPKSLTYAVYTIVALTILGMLFALYETEIQIAYDKAVFTPPASIAGLAFGDSRSDVISRMGESDEKCTECNENIMLWNLGSESRLELIIATFEAGQLRAVTTRHPRETFGANYLLNTTENLIELLGEPDILAISPDLLMRRYTYLEWGVSFDYRQGILQRVMIGYVLWRQISDPNQEYFVGGRQLCPGSDCPWDEAGDLRPGYEDKSHRDYL